MPRLFIYCYYKILTSPLLVEKSKSVTQINFSIHSITQNNIENEKYLKDNFESVEELKDIIISYRLWNLKTIKENEVNSNIIKTIEEHYNLTDLKQKLTQNDFIKIKRKCIYKSRHRIYMAGYNKRRNNRKRKMSSIKRTNSNIGRWNGSTMLLG